MDKYDYFISWTGDYGRRLAEELRNSISELTLGDKSHKPAINTFVSSVSIGNGARWRAELHSALENVDRGLILVTQDIMHSDWLAHEAGALVNRVETTNFLLVDTPLSLLPAPLQDHQCRQLSNPSIASLIQELIEWKKLTLPADFLNRLYKRIELVRSDYSNQYVTSDNKRWEGKIERPLLVSQQRESPFDFYEITRVARRRIIFVAQNHRFMTDPRTEMKCWESIRSALTRGVKVEIVAMHGDVRPAKLGTSEQEPADATNLWAHYMNAAAFFRHLDECWETLTTWKGRAADEGISGLKIIGTYFPSLSITVVDPDDSTGFLVLSPRPPLEAKQTRPQFILFKQSSPVSFEYYWTAIDNSSDYQEWKEM